MVEDQVMIAPAVDAQFDFSINNSEVTFINLTQNANSYQWDFGDGSSFSNEENPVHTYDNPGTYEVTLSATSPFCGALVESTIFLDFVDVTNISNEHFLKLYPNPTNDFVNIETNMEGTLSLNIFTINGEELPAFRQSFYLNENINVEELPAGLYIVKITRRGEQYQLKLMKF